MAIKIPFNDNWEFCPSFTEGFLAGDRTDGTVTVELPHSVVETPFNYFDESVYQMVCGYRKRIRVPEEWAGRRVFLNVGAAAHSACVYIDGKRVCEHRCGYTSFKTELTGFLKPGSESLLAIRVDSREEQDIPPFGYVIDYMTYGGLYREVCIEVTGPRYISDVFVKPAVPDTALLRGGETAEQAAAVSFAGTLISEVQVYSESPYTLRQSVYRADDHGGEPLARAVMGPFNDKIAALKMDVPDARLWDPLSPTLFTLVTELITEEDVRDENSVIFGFRRAEFRTEGFWLNGRKFKIRGLNRHQSYPYVGYAMPASMQRLDADILRNELGVNAVRTSHYPQSPHFVDRCDELGLLVFTEIPGWQHIGDEEWKKQAVKNTEEMVTQYRNHPSIILWGVRINESADDDDFYLKTNAAAKRLDDTRQTGGVRCHKKSSLLEDVYTYNDFVHDGRGPGCLKKRSVTSCPEKPYMITEYNGHMYPTKTYDSEEHRLEHALRHAAVLDAVAGEEDIAGCFGWCMADYNTHKDFGSGDRICYHGVLDMFRNPKMAAYVYSAQQNDHPVLEISSSMDIGEHPGGNRGRVFAFSNADSVRLYKNGTFIREYKSFDSPYGRLEHPPVEVDDFVGSLLEENEGFTAGREKLVKDILNYCARFGTTRLPLTLKLKALWLTLRWKMSFSDAYDLYSKYIGDWGKAATVYRFDAVEDGKVVSSISRSPVTKTVLSVKTDHTRLVCKDTYDVSLVRISVTDQNGAVLPFWNGSVKTRISGPISLIGPEGCVLRGGLGGVFVRSGDKSGTGELELFAQGMEPVIIKFAVQIRGDGITV